MGRWEPDSRGRLAQAALELYDERGFDNTTVAEIAERAGVTERTFFRHFADKREVLFGGGAALADLLVEAVATAPKSSAPIDYLAAALDAAVGILGDHPEFSLQRQRIINASGELRERELIKLASLAAALTDAMVARGVSAPVAGLTAEAGMAVFRLAVERWNAETPRRDLSDVMRDSLDDLRAMTAGG